MNVGSFGKNLVLLNGWNFTPVDYEKTWREGKLLTAQIELSNMCDLLCEYCFRAEQGIMSKKRLPNEISVNETISIIDAIDSLEVKAINIIGAGEPTIDPVLIDVVKYISNKNIIPIISTHGARLTENLVSELYANNASVIIKVNSFNPVLQDKLVNRNDYAKKRDKGIRLLIEAGFNKQTAYYQTRLGINSIVLQENKDEIFEIHKYCRLNNIMPIMSTFIPAGRTKDRTDMEISQYEFIEISKKVRDIDREQHKIEYQRLIPYLGGVPCTQCSKSSIYVNILGDIFECPGQQKKYGNIKDISIEKAFENIKKDQENYDFSCPPRMNYWKSNT